MNGPYLRITDNDAGEITATVKGVEIRGWSYKDATEQRVKMLMAHEFAEGWFQATHRLSKGPKMEKLLEPFPTGFDPLEALKNERDYVGNTRVSGTTHRALEWAVTEIERLRKELAIKELTPSAQ
jgi:hypothetical protein